MRNNRFLTAIMTLITSMFTTTAFAYDIAVENADGVMIYYNYVNDRQELEVTYKDETFNSYSGSIKIPEEVVYYNTTLKVTGIGDNAFYLSSDMNSITIPNGVVYFGVNAFRFTGITSITIPESVVTISDNAFKYCYNLTSVTIGRCVTKIGKNAFESCNLTSITLPNSLTTIDDNAFWGCSIKSITIPSNVTYIGQNIIGGYHLASIVVESGNTTYDSREGCNAIIETSKNSLLIGCTNTTIPSSVTSIGQMAFYFCSNLSSIIIPNSVTHIGENAFRLCSKLTSITIPNFVTSIGEGAFSGCSTLTSIDLPNSITSIGNNTFEDCSALKSIVIPQSITSIGKKAFYKCLALSSIAIPNNVTSIDDYAFSNCTNLATIIFPSTVTPIGQRSFANCTNLADVFCYNELPSPYRVASDAFEGSFINHATLHVPASAISKYERTNLWTDFGTIVSVPTLTYMVDGQIYKTSTPMVGEAIVAEEEPTRDNYIFSGWSEIPETMPGNDVTITGSFKLIDTAEPCAKPTIGYKNGQLTFESETQGAEFVYDIKDDDVKAGSGSMVNLSVTYTITVYATCEGYQDSETATATLCWIDVDPQTEGITEDTPTDVVNVKAHPVLIQRDGNIITISGTSAGTPISIYDLSGRLIESSTAVDGVTRVGCGSDKVVIVKVGERSVKAAQ